MANHQNKIKKLNRPKPHREAMMANMATSLLAHRTVETTDARAKELRRMVDRLISTAKKDTTAARRQVARTIRDKDVLKKLFNDIVPQFKERQSGFTRVLKVGYRRGDASLMSMVELLTKPDVREEEKKDSKKKKKKAKES